MNLAELLDEQLYKLIGEKNEIAFQEIYNRYWDQLFRKVMKLTNESELAADIVQDVFMDLWSRAGQVEIQHVRAYLYQSIRYQVADKLHKVKFTKEQLDVLAKHESPLSVENYIHTKDLEIQIDALIGQLPEKCREIFNLSRKDLLSNKEIAEKLGISQLTVETQIKRALKKLRENGSHLQASIIVVLLNC